MEKEVERTDELIPPLLWELLVEQMFRMLPLSSDSVLIFLSRRDSIPKVVESFLDSPLGVLPDPIPKRQNSRVSSILSSCFLPPRPTTNLTHLIISPLPPLLQNLPPLLSSLPPKLLHSLRSSLPVSSSSLLRLIERLSLELLLPLDVLLSSVSSGRVGFSSGGSVAAVGIGVDGSRGSGSFGVVDDF